MNSSNSCGRARQALDQFAGHLRGDGGFNRVALRLADAHQLLGAQALLGQIGVVGDDHVGRGWPPAAFSTKPAQPQMLEKTQMPPKLIGSTCAMPNGS